MREKRTNERFDHPDLERELRRLELVSPSRLTRSAGRRIPKWRRPCKAPESTRRWEDGAKEDRHENKEDMCLVNGCSAWLPKETGAEQEPLSKHQPQE